MCKQLTECLFAFWLLTSCFSPKQELVTALNQPEPVTPFSLVENCPSNRFVADKYPDFSSEENLVTLVDNKLAFVDITTGTIRNYDYPVADIIPPVVSPDGKHISYISGFDSERKLWLFTPSTGEPPKSFTISPDTFFERWISNNKIALWNHSDSYECIQYDGFFNLQTEDVIRPKNRIPEMEQSRCLRLPSINSDGFKALYPWQVKDLNSGISYDIALFDKIITNPADYFLGWSNDLISIASYEGNTLSYKTDMPISSLNGQPIKLQTIQLPAFAIKGTYGNPPVIELNIKRFGWDLIDQNTDVSGYDIDPNKGNLPTDFYLVNLDTNQFTNYCLDRSVPSDPEKISLAKPVQQGYFSPDGKYLAWTIYSTADYTPPIETQVLDLETGKVIVFENVETLGWVVP